MPAPGRMNQAKLNLERGTPQPDMKKMLLFDIDGTLLLTGGTGRIAFERAFYEIYGIDNSWGHVIPDGKTDQMIFGEIFERHFGQPPRPNELKNLFIHYARHFEKEIDITPGFKIMPGIPDLIRRLSNLSHIALGIATGNIAEVSHYKLRRADLHHYFHFMATASDSHDRPTLVKHAIERGLTLTGPLDTNSIFVIGDAEADVHAAKKNGVRSIAVATGSTSRQTLQDLQPDYLLDDLSNHELLFEILG